MSSPVGGLTRVAVSASSSGANTLVAAVAGYQIAVRELVLVPADVVMITLKSGSTALTGGMPIGGTGLPGFGLPYSPADHVVTDVGQPLVLNLSGAVAVTGYLVYALLGP